MGVNFRPQKVACVASAFCWGGAVEGSASKHAKPRKEWEGGFARAFAGLFLKICAFNLSVKCQRSRLILASYLIYFFLNYYITNIIGPDFGK